MSTRITKVAWRALWLIATGLFSVALLALIAVSVDQAYTVVVKSLLTSSVLGKKFWVGALIAATIPFGFLSVYSFILLVMYGHRAWQFISRQRPP
jgi:hypothetical protein